MTKYPEVVFTEGTEEGWEVLKTSRGELWARKGSTLSNGTRMITEKSHIRKSLPKKIKVVIERELEKMEAPEVIEEIKEENKTTNELAEFKKEVMPKIKSLKESATEVVLNLNVELGCFEISWETGTIGIELEDEDFIEEVKEMFAEETHKGEKVFDNISNINDWSDEELKSAIEYYQKELLKPHDDVEHNWFLRAIGKCKSLLDERTGNKSEWESLFN